MSAVTLTNVPASARKVGEALSFFSLVQFFFLVQIFFLFNFFGSDLFFFGSNFFSAQREASKFFSSNNFWGASPMVHEFNVYHYKAVSATVHLVSDHHSHTFSSISPIVLKM